MVEYLIISTCYFSLHVPTPGVLSFLPTAYTNPPIYPSSTIKVYKAFAKNPFHSLNLLFHGFFDYEANT